MQEHNQGTILSLFPTPVYTCKIGDMEFNDVQSEIDIVTQKLYSCNIWAQKHGWDHGTHFLSNQGNFEQSILDIENMNVVKEFILRHTYAYMSMLNVKDGFEPYIESSWLTLTKPGLYAHIHDHGTNDISGVYWFKTNGIDGDIYFRNALKALKCNPLGNTMMNETKFSPEQGRIVLWPSYLDHGVHENNTPDDRISLSFNIRLQKYK